MPYIQIELPLNRCQIPENDKHVTNKGKGIIELVVGLKESYPLRLEVDKSHHSL